MDSPSGVACASRDALPDSCRLKGTPHGPKTTTDHALDAKVMLAALFFDLDLDSWVDNRRSS